MNKLTVFLVKVPEKKKKKKTIWIYTFHSVSAGFWYTFRRIISKNQILPVLLMFAYKLHLLLQNHGWWGFRFSWLFRKVHKSIQKCVWKEYAASYRIMKIAAQGLIVLFGGKEVISGNIWANSPLQMFILLFIAASEHYLFMYEYIKIILLFSTLFNILGESLKITTTTTALSFTLPLQVA